MSYVGYDDSGYGDGGMVTGGMYAVKRKGKYVPVKPSTLVNKLKKIFPRATKKSLLEFATMEQAIGNRYGLRDIEHILESQGFKRKKTVRKARTTKKPARPTRAPPVAPMLTGVVVKKTKNPKSFNVWLNAAYKEGLRGTKTEQREEYARYLKRWNKDYTGLGTGGAKRTKRPLTAYQKFVKKNRLAGYSMAQIGSMWRNT